MIKALLSRRQMDAREIYQHNEQGRGPFEKMDLRLPPTPFSALFHAFSTKCWTLRPTYSDGVMLFTFGQRAVLIHSRGRVQKRPHFPPLPGKHNTSSLSTTLALDMLDGGQPSESHHPLDSNFLDWLFIHNHRAISVVILTLCSHHRSLSYSLLLTIESTFGGGHGMGNGGICV